MTDEEQRYVHDAFDHWVRSGYDADVLVAEIPERVQDLVGKPTPAFVQALKVRVTAALAAQRALEATWTEPTTNDRIEEAFAELTDAGIVALENAGYTTSDGWSDVNEAATGLEGVRGGVFFHGQDVERAVRGEGLYLTYGAFEKGSRHAEASVAVGREVCEVLAKYGVPTEWNGTVKAKIRIPAFEWRKRAATEAP